VTSRLVLALIAVVALVAIRLLVSRVRYGRRLTRIGEQPAPTQPLVGSALVAVYLVAPWVESHIAWARSVEWLVYLAGVVIFFATPPPAGSWAIFENGIMCAEGPKPEFVHWQELDRFEWNGDIVIIHRGPTLIGSQSESHSLEVPSERRSALEGILATRLPQRS
jgi:hypothetical protein